MARQWTPNTGDAKFDSLWTMPIEELPKRGNLDAQPDSPVGRAADAILRARIMMMAADEQARHARHLVLATWALALATIALAFLSR